MRNNKKLFLISIVFVLIAIMIISSVIIIKNNMKSNSTVQNENHIKIYYYDKVNNNISYEEKAILIEDTTFVDTIFNNMKLFPDSINLQSVIPKELNIISYNVNNYLLTINLSSYYDTMSDVEKLLFKACFVWSITDTGKVKNVEFLVDGNDLDNNFGEYYNKNNIIINPVLLPDKIELETVVLYYANSDNMLIAEERNIEVKQNKSMEQHIIEELINGPVYDENIRTVPSETKIRNIKTEDNICYLDLSSDFISGISNDKTKEELAIYSIVNSLTNLSNVNKVQFLIDGEKVNLSKDSIDISQPIGRYESIIISNDKEGEE